MENNKINSINNEEKLINLDTQIVLESKDSEIKENITTLITANLFKEGFEKPIFNLKRLGDVTNFIIAAKQFVNESEYNNYINKIYLGCFSIGISIKGESFDIQSINEFSKMCPYASNMSIFPLTDGTVSIDFMFYDIILNNI